MTIALPGYPHRLTGPFEPASYDLYLKILDLDPEWETDASGKRVLLSKRVPGREVVIGTLSEATNKIVLNARDIEVHSASAIAGGRNITTSEITYDEGYELVTFIFAEELPAGPVSLELTFTNTFVSRDEGLSGLYQAIYTTAEGEERIQATTQFEAMDARAMFPCVDQPDAKATFSLSVRIPIGEIAVSNMPIAVEEDFNDGTKIVEFERTPKISTYVLYVGVAQFDVLELENPTVVPMSAYTTPGNAEKARTVLEFGNQVLAWLEDQFGVPYPLPKCDFIGVPDFASGAMEGFGAVTFHESLFFVDKHTPIDRLRLCCMVVAHELAHMWLGDDVTMRWWNDLWLNESFATFIAYLALDELKPEWRVFEEYLVMQTAEGMNLASLKSGHPIEVDIVTPTDSVQKFDAISYGMGGSILRYLYATIGRDAFMQGVRLYLTRHHFGNATTADLCEAWDEVSDIDVSALMQTWTRQTGFPVLLASKGTHGTAAISQHRFLATGVDVDAKPDQLWNIPVQTATPSGATRLYSMDNASMVMTGLSAEGPVLLNKEQAGFYVVRYDPAWLLELTEAVSKGQFSNLERWGLLADMARLLLAGLVTVKDYLTVISAYVTDRNPYIWKTILEETKKFVSIFEQVDDPYAQEFKDWARSVFMPLSLELGWEAEPYDDEDTQQLRGYALEGSCIFGDEEEIAKAVALFASAGDDLGQLDPNVVLPVLQAVALRGDETTLERLIELYESKTTPGDVRQKLLIAMGYFLDESLLAEAFAFCVSGSVRPHDYWRGWRYAPGHARQAAWNAYLRHRDAFDGAGKNASRFAIAGALGYVPLRSRIEEAKAYFEANPAPNASDAIAQTLETCEAAVAFAERNEGTLEALFAEAEVQA